MKVELLGPTERLDVRSESEGFHSSGQSNWNDGITTD